MPADPRNPITGTVPATRLVLALMHRLGVEQVFISPEVLDAVRGYELGMQSTESGQEGYLLVARPRSGGVILPR